MKQSIIAVLAIVLLIGSCRVEEKIVDGERAFERRQYANAITLLEKEYNKSKRSTERAKKAFLIGESFRIINQPESSKDWYMKAFDAGYSTDALKQYAYALKELEQYDEAIQAFKDVGAEIGDPYQFQREIVACRQARTWKKNKGKSDYKIELPKFNSSTADYYPVVYKNDQLIITSDRGLATGDKTYKWTGNSFSDLFIVGEGGDISNFSKVINSKYNEGTITFNNDFTEAYFSRCGEDSNAEVQYCKLMYSELIGEEWSEPQVIDFVEDEVNYGHPSLSKDNRTLYFSSDHPEGLGGFDIYKVTRNGEGWGEPQNLTAAINTEGNEVAPFIDADTLYFASDFHVGMGGLDIFKTAKWGNRWGPLQNLRAPINSGADDFGLIIDYRKTKDDRIVQQGYYTSTRPEGKGNDDIYKFMKVIPPPKPEPAIDSEAVAIDTVQDEPVIVYEMFLNGRVMEKIYNNPDDPNSGVQGKAIVPNANVKISFNDTTFNVKTDDKGGFRIQLDEQTYHNFTISKDGYLSKDDYYSTRGVERNPDNPVRNFSKDFEIDKIFRNTEITLQGIYYDLDKAYIRPDAKPVLNRLANILINNPNINIELASHTDCRGGNGYNQNLSQRRAQSAVDYLVAKGIARERMTARGYGETVPVTNCACNRCSEEEHQLNRRTTFKIIE